MRLIDGHAEAIDDGNQRAILKGVFIRGLTVAWLRSPDTPLSQYLEAYILVQVNTYFSRVDGPALIA